MEIYGKPHADKFSHWQVGWKFLIVPSRKWMDVCWQTSVLSHHWCSSWHLSTPHLDSLHFHFLLIKTFRCRCVTGCRSSHCVTGQANESWLKDQQCDVRRVSSGWTTLWPAATRGAWKRQKHPLPSITYKPAGLVPFHALRLVFRKSRLPVWWRGGWEEEEGGMGQRGRDRHREGWVELRGCQFSVLLVCCCSVYVQVWGRWNILKGEMTKQIESSDFLGGMHLQHNLSHIIKPIRGCPWFYWVFKVSIHMIMF